MKIKNKGKVHPSPSSSSSFTPLFCQSTNRDALSVLTLLPAAILALASVLSPDDREVLAYLITRSMKTTINQTPNPSSLPHESKKKPTKNHPPNAAAAHKKPTFDCDCFDCYTSYWYRWDSSPNRELIHQAIEAFEEHLANGEQSKKNARGKRRDKTARREKAAAVTPTATAAADLECSSAEVMAKESWVVVPESSSPEKDEPVEVEVEAEVEVEKVELTETKTEEKMTTALVTAHIQGSNHKGLARKVLPDVLGILNSRLWSLWGPDV